MKPRVLETGLMAAVIFSVLCFGAVPLWGSMTVCAIVFTLIFIFPDSLNQIRFLPKPVQAALCLVAVIIIIQLSFSSFEPATTLLEVLKALSFLGVFLLVQCLPVSGLRRLIFVLIGIGTFEAGLGIFLQAVGTEIVLWIPKSAHLGDATGTYFNRNHFAALLELSLGLHFALGICVFRRARMGPMILWASVMFLLIAGLLQSSSRMGILSFVVSMVAVCILMFRAWKQKDLLFAGLLGVLFVCVWIVNAARLGMRFEEVQEGLRLWDGGRVWAWTDAFKMLQDAPWLGVGLGNFEWAFPFYQSARLVAGWNHVHNDYLELAIELGLPGFMALLTAAGIYFKSIFKKIPNLSDSEKPLLMGMLISLGAFALHAFADFNFAIPANTLIFFLILGILGRIHTPSEPFCEI